ncbi:hypothetical protein [Nocardioides donggukensis]|uniref:DUF2567 domain-containing protein n=1 Tax=Nocardioides donggukensis TaxID=2774019 RepID=A0A927PYY8_9ACTN|nr:hypothetical protein [Nocardioides donggukensis]MBD8869233.1 hypothetical protein [Nocardioides donggukensis]
MASDRLARGRDAVLVVLGFTVAGALCGWLWHALWAPAPTGVVVGETAYFPPDQEFAGTGLYMLIAVLAGLVLGGVATFLLERDEVVTLAATVLGAVAAGAVMALVGHLLGPESVAEAIARTADYEEVRSDLRVGTPAAYAAFPGGALMGAVLVLVTFTRHTHAGEPTGVGSASHQA